MDEEMRLVLLGKTGCGKSATGNSIFGTKKFESTLCGSSITRGCSQNSVVRFGKKIVIVDTPGIFDTEDTNENIQSEIYKCIGITSPGPHAFVLVLSVGERYTTEVQCTIAHFEEYFGEELYRYLIILITRKDELIAHQISLEEYINTCPSEFQKLINKCGKRVCAFDNNLQGDGQDDQVKELLSIISENINKNDGNFYTNEMYAEAEKKIKAIEEEKLKHVEDDIRRKSELVEEEYNKELENTKNEIGELEKNREHDGRQIQSLETILEENETKLRRCDTSRRPEVQESIRALTNQIEQSKNNYLRRTDEIKEKKRISLEICQRREKLTPETQEKVNKALADKRMSVRDETRKEIEEKKKAWLLSGCMIM